MATAQPLQAAAAGLSQTGEKTAVGVAAQLSPSPSLWVSAAEMDLKFQRLGRGPDFWRTRWLETDAERAIELANENRPLQMKVSGKPWQAVPGLDELHQMVHQARQEWKQELLAKQGSDTATQAALAAAGCAWATPAATASAQVGMLGFVKRALSHVNNPASFLREAHAKHGPSFQVDLPTKGHLLFDARSEVLRQALLNTDSGDDTWMKSKMQGHGASFLIGEKNMFLSGGQDWKFIQETLRPHLSGKIVHSEAMVDKLTGIFDKHIEDLKLRVAASPNGEITINPRQEMQRAALDIAMQVFLGSHPSDQELRTMQQAFATQIEWLTKESLNPTNVSLSVLPGMGELREAYATLNGVDKLIADRQAMSERPKDMLTGLVEAVDPASGQPMDALRLRHEVLSLLEAGHETTATLMGWSLLMLARHPEEYAKLQKEIDAKLGERKPTAKEVTGMAATDQVTDESLRLYPPFYLFMREAKEDTSLGPADHPIQVAKGTTLVTNLYVTQRDEQIWGEQSTGYPANEFHPDRFAGETPKMTPFGMGKRSCIGQAMGRLENQLLLTRFAQAFEMEATSQGPIKLGSDLSINSHDETVRIRLRKP